MVIVSKHFNHSGSKVMTPAPPFDRPQEANPVSICSVPLVPVRYAAAKRTLDISVALFFLTVGAPVLAAI
nr:hypothetical protein [Armatimonadota bacterium]